MDMDMPLAEEEIASGMYSEQPSLVVVEAPDHAHDLDLLAENGALDAGLTMDMAGITTDVEGGSTQVTTGEVTITEETTVVDAIDPTPEDGGVTPGQEVITTEENGNTVEATADAGDDGGKPKEFGPGEPLVGRKVMKKFGRKYYRGDIISFDPETTWYKVVYEDGDQEELWWAEVEPLLQEVTTPAPKRKRGRPPSVGKRSNKKPKREDSDESGDEMVTPNVKIDVPSDGNTSGRASTRRGSKRKAAAEAERTWKDGDDSPPDSPPRVVVTPKTPKVAITVTKEDAGTEVIGSKTKKKFGRKVYHGEVIGYDLDAKYYKVRYEDGDEEELEWTELKRTLTDSSSSKAAVSDSISDLQASDSMLQLSDSKAALPRMENTGTESESEHPAIEAAKIVLEDPEAMEFHAWGEVVSYDRVRCPELQAAKMFPTASHSILHMATSHHHLAVATVVGQVWVWRVRHGNIHDRCNQWEHIPDLDDKDIVLVDIAGPDVDRTGYGAEQEDQVPDPFYLVAVSRDGKDFIFQGSKPHEPVCTNRLSESQYQGLDTLIRSNGLSTEGVGRIVQASIGVVKVFDEPPFIGYITDTDRVYIRCVTEDHVEGVVQVTGFTGRPTKIQCGGAYNAVLMTDDGGAWTWGDSDLKTASSSSVCRAALGSLARRKVVDVACHGQDFAAVTDDGGLHYWTNEAGSELGNEPVILANSAEKLGCVALGSGVCATISESGKVHTWRTPKQAVTGRLFTPLGRDVESTDTLISGLGAREALRVFCTESSLIVMSHKRSRKRKGADDEEDEEL